MADSRREIHLIDQHEILRGEYGEYVNRAVNQPPLGCVGRAARSNQTFSVLILNKSMFN